MIVLIQQILLGMVVGKENGNWLKNNYERKKNEKKFIKNIFAISCI